VAHVSHPLDDALTRAARLDMERGIVRAILNEAPDREGRKRLWKERTGKCEASFYNRRREVEREDAEAERVRKEEEADKQREAAQAKADDAEDKPGAADSTILTFPRPGT
jgi:hypothetical protein